MRPFKSLALAVAALAAAIAGCQSNASTTVNSAQTSQATSAVDWTAVRRPLHLPFLQPGAVCPLSNQQVAHDLSAEFGFGPAVGKGPVYPLMGEMQGGALRYSVSYSRSHYKDGWAASKVLWMAKPEVQGPVLIRGHQLAGPNAVGFGQAADPDSELRLMAPEHHGTAVWSDWPSETRVRAPGCYAYQADDQKGSEIIVFQVVGIG